LYCIIFIFKKAKRHNRPPFYAYQQHQQYHQQQKALKSTATTFDNDHDVESRDSYHVSQTLQGIDACTKVGIDKIGITNPTTIFLNMTYKQIYEHEQANSEGDVATAEYGDTFAVSTGKFTGRSPNDKFVVFNPGTQSAENMDWNDINKQTTPEVFDELNEKAVNYFNTLDKAYVFDCYVGASPHSRKKIRFIHEMAWQQVSFFYKGYNVKVFVRRLAHDTEQIRHMSGIHQELLSKV
jgi:hypothetical protein